MSFSYLVYIFELLLLRLHICLQLIHELEPMVRVDLLSHKRTGYIVQHAPSIGQVGGLLPEACHLK